MIALALVGLLALVSATAPRWSRFLRQPLVQSGDEEFGHEPNVPAPEATAALRAIKVKLFFESPEGDGLVLEERDVPYDADLARQVEIAVEELVRGSRDGNLPPLPPETRVLGAFVTRAGVAYVNLSQEARAGGSGSRTELLSVYALVNSLTSSFPAVKRVQVLVDDRPAGTLWGHVDLNRPLPPDLTQLAALEAFKASAGLQEQTSPAPPSPPPPGAAPATPAPVAP